MAGSPRFAQQRAVSLRHLTQAALGTQAARPFTQRTPRVVVTEPVVPHHPLLARSPEFARSETSASAPIPLGRLLGIGLIVGACLVSCGESKEIPQDQDVAAEVATNPIASTVDGLVAKRLGPHREYYAGLSPIPIKQGLADLRDMPLGDDDKVRAQILGVFKGVKSPELALAVTWAMLNHFYMVEDASEAQKKIWGDYVVEGFDYAFFQFSQALTDMAETTGVDLAKPSFQENVTVAGRTFFCQNMPEALQQHLGEVVLHQLAVFQVALDHLEAHPEQFADEGQFKAQALRGMVRLQELVKTELSELMSDYRDVDYLTELYRSVHGQHTKAVNKAGMHDVYEAQIKSTWTILSENFNFWSGLSSMGFFIGLFWIGPWWARRREEKGQTAAVEAADAKIESAREAQQAALDGLTVGTVLTQEAHDALVTAEREHLESIDDRLEAVFGAEMTFVESMKSLERWKSKAHKTMVIGATTFLLMGVGAGISTGMHMSLQGYIPIQSPGYIATPTHMVGPELTEADVRNLPGPVQEKILQLLEELEAD